MKLSQNIFIALFVALFAAAIPEFAFADASFKIAHSLCSAYNLVNGGAGKAIATIAILTLGFMALLGRIQWGLVILVAVGIAVIFAAPEIADAVGGDNGQTCGTENVG